MSFSSVDNKRVEKGDKVWICVNEDEYIFIQATIAYIKKDGEIYAVNSSQDCVHCAIEQVYVDKPTKEELEKGYSMPKLEDNWVKTNRATHTSHFSYNEAVHRQELELCREILKENKNISDAEVKGLAKEKLKKSERQRELNLAYGAIYKVDNPSFDAALKLARKN